MQIGSFILDGLRNQDQNTGQTQPINIETQPANQVLGTANQGIPTQIFPFGPDCCPTTGPGGNVLGEQARTIEVPEVLGANTGNTLVEVCIPVIPPGIVILFDQIVTRIVFDALVPAHNKVFINGRLIKTIPYQVCRTPVTPTAGNIIRFVSSELRAVTIEVPFAMCIPVQGAVQGTQVVVLESNVDSVNLPNLRCPNQECIRSIVEKDCITVRVKVVRDVMINVNGTEANI